MPDIHLIGIGGAGLSAIATVLLEQGYRVSGSDIQPSATTARLESLGAEIHIGHHPKNLGPQPDAVIISSAIGSDNPELQEARRRGLNVTKRAAWLGRMMEGQTGIAVAGTHGKTTTTAMIAYLLQEGGCQPTYIVGGYIPQLKTSAAAGGSRIFVIEADEYDHMFLGLQPEVAVLTIVEWDHPDIYPTAADLNQAFAKFVELVPSDGLIIGCGDAPGVRPLLSGAVAQVVTYGLAEDNDWQAVNCRSNQRGGFDFDLIAPQPDRPKVAEISLALPGLHNVANALAALVVVSREGLNISRAAEILADFQGVGRRFELKGQAKGITVIDDYAHHPTEIRATLAGARARFADQPLWVVFQPHTFSRSLALLEDFRHAFDDADQVIIVDIFASREADAGLITSRDIVDQVAHPAVRYIGLLEQAVDYLTAQLASPAVLITMGAGDGYLVGERVLERIGSQER